RFKSVFVFTPLLLLRMGSSGADLSFYAVYKTEKFNQASASAPTVGSGSPYRIEAIVDPMVSNSVTTASVTAPGGAPQSLTFDPVNNWLSFSAKFSSQAALDAAAPSGNYKLVVNTLHQGQKALTLNLPAETFPGPPHISNWNAAQAINPAANFMLRWDPFGG